MYSTKLSVSIHLLCLVARSRRPVTSDVIAASIGTNPALVRRLMARLKAAGLLRTRPRVGAVGLGRPAVDITLLDIFNAVEPNRALFDIHGGGSAQCPVGAHIGEILAHLFGNLQRQMETGLAAATLADLLGALPPTDPQHPCDTTEGTAFL